MDSRKALGSALRNVRISKGLSQESFSDVSSRTYLSTLERGLKSPTLLKLEALCATLGIHDLTLLTLALAYRDEKAPEQLLQEVKQQLATLDRVEINALNNP